MDTYIYMYIDKLICMCVWEAKRENDGDHEHQFCGQKQPEEKTEREKERKTKIYKENERERSKIRRSFGQPFCITSRKRTDCIERRATAGGVLWSRTRGKNVDDVAATGLSISDRLSRAFSFDFHSFLTSAPFPPFTRAILWKNSYK